MYDANDTVLPDIGDLAPIFVAELQSCASGRANIIVNYWWANCWVYG